MDNMDIGNIKQLRDKLEVLKGYLIKHKNHSTNISCIEYMIHLLKVCPFSDTERSEIKKGISYLMQARNLPDNCPTDITFTGCEWLNFLEDIRRTADRITNKSKQ